VEGRAYRQAFLATRDRDEARDLVQEAMLRLATPVGPRPERRRGGATPRPARLEAGAAVARLTAKGRVEDTATLTVRQITVRLD